jgi:putative membrane protein
MIKHTVVFAAVGIFFAGCSQSTEQLGGKSSSSLSSMDNDFFKTITISNETEIQSSQLALIQSQTPAIRDFAEKMISDHQAAEKKVATLAGNKGVVLPARIDDMHQKKIDDLRDKSGAAFDKVYADLQVKAHQATIVADRDEANKGDDADVKALANELLPTLQMHLQMAQQMQSGVGGM